MGIVVSIPHLEGLVTVSSLSSATYPISSVFGSADSGVSTTTLNHDNTRSAFVSAVSPVRTVEAPPANATNVVLFNDPSSPGFRETATTNVHTATVTSKIQVTSLITVTTTVISSTCPTKLISNTIPSVSSIGASHTDVKTPTYSSQPTVSPVHEISLFSRLPADGAHMAESSILTLSSPPVATWSQYNKSMNSERTGSGVGSSPSSFPIAVTSSNNVLSLSRMNASTLRSLATSVSSKSSSSFFPPRNPTQIVTGRPAGPLHVASVSHSGQRTHTTGVRNDGHYKSDHLVPSHGPPKELTSLARVTGSRHLTIPPSIYRKPPAAWTKVKDLTTTTTIYTTSFNKHTSTTTLTAFRTICPPPTTTTTFASTTTPTSSPPCASATPNPKPPANNTCAENGLLEMSSTLQPPSTLDGCALACLTDTSCLSFTFIPDQKTCSTSLYPLVDSAFAGLQEEAIYNYDRGCYECAEA